MGGEETFGGAGANPTFGKGGGSVNGGGGSNANWNNAQVYVAPAPIGSDIKGNGSDEKPYMTLYRAYQAIVAAKGGTIWAASGVLTYDPANLGPDQVLGQGLWTRSDPVAHTVKGFLPSVPCRITAWGSGDTSLGNPFQGLTAFIGAGSNLPADYRTKPGFWNLYTTGEITLENIQVVPMPGFEDGEPGLYCAYRTGWDYNRLPSGDPLYQAIASGTRTGSAGNGQTAFNIDLAPVVTFAIGDVFRYQSINLPGNPWVVHCRFHRPGPVEVPPWGVGAGIWFDTVDPAFTPGAYTVIWSQATTLAASDWDVEFIDSSNTPAVSVDPSTVRSTVAVPGSYVEVEGNTSGQFPATVYPVITVIADSPTTGVITVKDIYGGYLAINVNQPLTPLVGYRLVHQERDLYMTASQVTYNNCTSRATQNPAKLFRMGNMFDFGGATAFTPRMNYCYLQGYKPLQASGIPYDETRMSAVFLRGGTITPAGLLGKVFTGHQASIRAILGSTSCSIELDDILFDTDGLGEPPPAYIIDGDAASFVHIDNVIVADSSAGFGASLNAIRGIPPLNITGNAATGAATGSVAPLSNSSRVPLGAPFNAGADSSPWTVPCPATFADLQLAIKHAASWRGSISPTNRRFLELAHPQNVWTPAPTNTGVEDPRGGFGAVSYDGSNPANTNIFIYSFDSVLTPAVGDRIVVSGWYNLLASPFNSSGQLFAVRTFGGNVVYKVLGLSAATGPVAAITDILIAPPFVTLGWQFCTMIAEILSTDGSPTDIQVILNGPDFGGPGVLAFDSWSFLYVVKAAATNTDLYEYVGAMRAQAQYLPVGMAGTFEGQKFIAHGGLGTAAKYVIGIGSGQITLGVANGNAIEIFDELGNSLGVVPLVGFVVNP